MKGYIEKREYKEFKKALSKKRFLSGFRVVMVNEKYKDARQLTEYIEVEISEIK